MNACGIVLAAGESRRMRFHKALLPVRGATLVEQAVHALQKGGVEYVIVVVRAGDEGVRSVLSDRRVALTENPDLSGDMLSSVRCGIRACPRACDTVAVAPVDMALLKPGTVRDILQKFETANPPGIVVPTYSGRRGHPLFFSSRYCEEVLCSFDGVGLRGLLQAHPSDVCECEVSDLSVLLDMDTPGDYTDALRRLGLRG